MTALLERAQLLFSGAKDEPVPDLGIEAPAAAGAEPDQLPELDADPEPGKRTRRRSAASKATAAKQTRTGGRFVSKATAQKDMAAELDAYAKLVALTWSMTDEHCSAVLNDTSTAITRDLAALLARSDWVMEKWQTTTLIGDLLKLGHSSMPLLRAMWVHHAGRGREEEAHEPVTVAADPDRYAPYRPTVTAHAG